ncbi:MAG: hypothetical protein M0Z36_04385 [Thermaerobacter sp.]|nr:hypothetical protein [Thermaerobacter sp.]
MMQAAPKHSKRESLANRLWLARIAEVITRDADRAFYRMARTRSGQGRHRHVDRTPPAEHARTPPRWHADS